MYHQQRHACASNFITCQTPKKKDVNGWVAVWRCSWSLSWVPCKKHIQQVLRWSFICLLVCFTIFIIKFTPFPPFLCYISIEILSKIHNTKSEDTKRGLWIVKRKIFITHNLFLTTYTSKHTHTRARMYVCTYMLSTDYQQTDCGIFRTEYFMLNLLLLVFFFWWISPCCCSRILISDNWMRQNCYGVLWEAESCQLQTANWESANSQLISPLLSAAQNRTEWERMLGKVNSQAGWLKWAIDSWCKCQIGQVRIYISTYTYIILFIYMYKYTYT